MQHATLIFKGFADRDVTKDPGFVMHYLAKRGMNCEILTAQRVKRPKWFLPRIKQYNNLFFFCSAKHILSQPPDILVLFHTHPLNPVYSILFKIRNRQGIVYVKTDMDNTVLNMRTFTLLNIVRRIKLWINVKTADIVSTEQEQVLKLLKSLHPKANLIGIPNAYGDMVPVKQLPFGKKENIILTVGPVGSTQKATDVILATVAKLKELGDWKIIMIGKVNEEFRPILNAFFQKHPQLKDRIELRGHVSDRSEMMHLYAKAKLILMPSRYETFSCALTEAAHYGVVVVGTPVGGVPELTQNGAYGAVCRFDDSSGLAKALQKRMHDSRLLEKESIVTTSHAKNYTWEKVILLLEKQLIMLQPSFQPRRLARRRP